MLKQRSSARQWTVGLPCGAFCPLATSMASHVSQPQSAPCDGQHESQLRSARQHVPKKGPHCLPPPQSIHSYTACWPVSDEDSDVWAVISSCGPVQDAVSRLVPGLPPRASETGLKRLEIARSYLMGGITRLVLAQTNFQPAHNCTLCTRPVADDDLANDTQSAFWKDADRDFEAVHEMKSLLTRACEYLHSERALLTPPS